MRLVVAGFMAAMIGASAAAQSAPLQVAEFKPPAGVFVAGSLVTSELVVKNVGASRADVWIGYSVRDSSGHWFDVEPSPASLAPNESARRSLSWRVPPRAVGGPYRVVMAVWTDRPGRATADRLLSVERDSAFGVKPNPSLLMEQPSVPWRAAAHPLGRGQMQPVQVSTDGGSFQLGLKANTCDGAEMRSAARMGFGTYTASLRVPDAPGSLSAWFLYKEGPSDNDEIDIEIFNDASRRVLLTAWIGGTKSREAEVHLPFDPRADFHAFEIEWLAETLTFRADGKPLARWTSHYAMGPMRVVANVWWPTWLQCFPPTSDRALEIRSITLKPSRPVG